MLNQSQGECKVTYKEALQIVAVGSAGVIIFDLIAMLACIADFFFFLLILMVKVIFQLMLISIATKQVKNK